MASSYVRQAGARLSRVTHDATRREEEFPLDGAVVSLAAAEDAGFRLKMDRLAYPIGSMYGVFTYIYHKNKLNVEKYTIHGWYGYL